MIPLGRVRAGVVALIFLGSMLLALVPAGAGAAASPATAVGPVPPRSAVTFYVRENDVRKVPAPGVTVTVTVTAGASDGAAVAPADRTGAATAAAGASAQGTSDRLGNAYFLLQAARTSGIDTYSWNDGHGHAGQVVVTVSATATLSPTATSVAVVAGPSPMSPSAAAGSTGVSAAGPVGAVNGATPPAAPTPLWRTVVTGLAGVLLAAALLFVLPWVVRRLAARRTRAQARGSAPP